MNLSNLFEGAIDDLEQRRIEDLESKMDDLARRAKESKDPKVVAALRHEFARCKAERDSYHYVSEWENTAPGKDAQQTSLEPVEEEWSQKYKDSINCSNPKGFSQKAHCAGKNKTDEAANPAQQAAIAINMKKHNQKPKTNEAVDTNYTYTVFIDGTKEGTYGSKEEAKAVVRRKKEQAPGRDYRIAPKPRTSMSSIKKHFSNRDRYVDEAEERLRVSPHDQGSFAAVKGRPYDSNPYPAGSKEHLEWSKGHNAMRARKADLDEHGGGGDTPRQWHAYVRSHRTDEGGAEYVRHSQGGQNVSFRNGKTVPISKDEFRAQQSKYWNDRTANESSEDYEPSPVAAAIVRRIMFNHPALLQDYGPNLVNAAVDNVADYVGDVEEIGSSDVSGWVKQVEQMLRDNPPEAFDEGYNSWGGSGPGGLRDHYAVYVKDKGGVRKLKNTNKAGQPMNTRDAEAYVAAMMKKDPAKWTHDTAWVAPDDIDLDESFGIAGRERNKNYRPGDTTIHNMLGPVTVSRINHDGSIEVLDRSKKNYRVRSASLGEASMDWAASKPTGPKFGGYLKGTDPAPTEFDNKGVGSCEEGAKVDRMQQHIAKSEKALGHSKKDAEAIGWATLNKRGYLDNANKKKHDESVNFMEWAVAQGNRFANFTSNPETYALAKAAYIAEGFGTSLANVSSKISGHPRKMKSAQQIRNRAMKFAPQPVAETHDDGEYNDEGGMAKNQIHTIKRGAEELEHLLSVDENLPEWIQLKLTLAQDYIQTAADYMASAHEREHEIAVGQDSINEIKKGQKDSNGYTKCWPGKHAEGTKIGKNGGRVRNCVPNESLEETEAWQKANKKDKTDGMSRKAVKAYRREHPGSKLKTAVTTKPSKLKKGSKASKRRKSYCSRSKGQMKMHSISCAKTPDKAICKARRRWNCEGVEHLDAMLAEAIEKGTLQPGQYYIWTVYFDDGSKKRIKVTKDNFDPKAYYAKQNKVVINTDYDWEVHNG